MSVECMLEVDYVRVIKLLHDLQLPILVSLVLVDLLDGDNLSSLRDTCLKDDPKGAIANDPICVVGEGGPLDFAG